MREGECVAATKSVVEQGLFYDSLLRNLRGEKMAGLRKAASQMEEVLTEKIDKKIISMMRDAEMIWFADAITASLPSWPSRPTRSPAKSQGFSREPSPFTALRRYEHG
jgi:hypothetical protein